MNPHLLSTLLVWYMVFLFSTSLHEACHALAAAWGGDDTAHRAGQMTLNPIPHIKRERWGMVVIPLLTFFFAGGSWMIGWASAPFNPYWAARHPKRSFAMALAGPLAHLALVIASSAALVVGMRTGFFAPGFEPESNGIVLAAPEAGGMTAALALAFSVMWRLNLVLFVFNLLPLPPLDGSEIWYLFVKSEEGRLRTRQVMHSYWLAGMLVAWYLFPRAFGFASFYALVTIYKLSGYNLWWL